MNRNKVEDVLFAMGIPANHKGFNYIVDAMEVIEKEDYTVSATKVLYPAIARKRKTTAGGVEAAIRHDLEDVRENGNQEVLEKYIGSANHTNMPALVSLYRHIKMEEESGNIVSG